jgi:hypothetical protein
MVTISLAEVSASTMPVGSTIPALSFPTCEDSTSGTFPPCQLYVYEFKQHEQESIYRPHGNQGL